MRMDSSPPAVYLPSQIEQSTKFQQPLQQQITQLLHPMHTRSKSGIHKPRHLFNLNHNIAVDIPTCASPTSLDPNWRDAMSDEYNALLNSHTWDLVPHHPFMNLVGCKWVFSLKVKSDGSIGHYKDRLVAQGRAHACRSLVFINANNFDKTP